MAALAVSDTLSNTPEQLEAVAKAIGRSKNRRAVFEDVYHGKTRIKRVTDIAKRTGLSEKDVLGAGKFLVDHHVINQVRVSGRVAYEKVGFFHKSKAKILGYVDHPHRLKNLATKRRTGSATAPLRLVRKSDLRKRKKLTVLLVTANPDADAPLRVDAEVRRVQEAIRGSKFAENVRVEYRPAADLKSILDGLNDLRPQVVHFSGHGNSAGLLTDTGKMQADPSDELSYDLLGKALDATDCVPDVVVLNSCHSSSAKRGVLRRVKFLVSMKVPISDIAAAAFAPQFYAALASGQSVQSAFKQGAVAVEAASISEAATPELHCNDADPSKAILT